jgi:hypothetical protein
MSRTSGLQDLKVPEWKAIQDKLKYLHGYYPDPEGTRFLKASIPGKSTVHGATLSVLSQY